MSSHPETKYRPIPHVHLPDRTWPEQRLTAPPVWCSVDLRDGNQALIEPMDGERKLRMFDALVAIGFKEIEAGFPSASQTDFDFLRRLIDEQRIPDGVTVQVLTQAREDLIRRTFEALEGVPRAILHVYHATAPVMCERVFGMQEQEVIERMTVPHVRLIRSLAERHPDTHWTFQYSPEMFSGTSLAFSKRVVDAVTEVWQPTAEHPCIINLPSTVEHSMPNVFADMIEWMHRNLERRDGVVLSVHPHNDRGTGTAAAELSLLAGAQRLEGCLFGNGERTGNLDLVNVALNMYAQGVHPGLDFSRIDEVRSVVEHCNQIPVHPRHPYVGDLVYTSFSGSHQDAIRKTLSEYDGGIWDIPYLPIDPRDVGRSYEAVIRVNSQSGKGGIAYLLETDHGLSLPRKLQIEFSRIVQEHSDDTGKEVTSAVLWDLFQREYLGSDSPYAYDTHHDGPAVEGAARLVLGLRHQGTGLRLTGNGSGPIEACVQALEQHGDLSLQLRDYSEHVLGSGANASAVCYVQLALDDGTARYGVGMDADIVAAAVKAVIGALNRLLAATPASEAEPPRLRA